MIFIIFNLGAQLCILVFSTVDRHSFDAIDSWMQKVQYLSSKILENSQNTQVKNFSRSNQLLTDTQIIKLDLSESIQVLQNNSNSAQVFVKKFQIYSTFRKAIFGL